MMGRTTAAILLLAAALPSWAAAQNTGRPAPSPVSVPSAQGAQALNLALDNQSAIAANRTVTGNIESMRPNTGGGSGKAPPAGGVGASQQSASAGANANPYFKSSGNAGEMPTTP